MASKSSSYNLPSLKVAIVHDWLTGLGGAERVVQSMLKLFPQADLFTSVYNPNKIDIFGDRQIKTTFLQSWPLAKSKHQLYAKMRPLAFESLDFSDYDLVISSSSAESKGIITRTETLHISYIHTPIRYYWSGYQDYLKNPGFGFLNPLVRSVMKSSIDGLRHWDYAAAQRPDFLIANSKVVKERIEKYYQRPSTVINPPVDTKRFGSISIDRPEYHLVVSRLVPYKRVDLAVKACSNLNLKLVVAGKGPELSKLKKLANGNVEFIENPSDKDINKLYSRAKSLIFSAEEDFGITPVEAMAVGVPVICYSRGGATETVINKETGIYHDQQTVKSLEKALLDFENYKFDRKSIVDNAERFSEDKFLENMREFISEKISR